MLEKGYGIMPNAVMFDENLTDKQKLLFCLISSLCAEKGYCWANNQYFAERFNCKKETISVGISKLQKHGYIYIDIDALEGNKRTMGIEKNLNTYLEKSKYPIAKNLNHNIINNNIYNKQEKIIYIKTKQDIKDILDEQYILDNQNQLYILYKMIELGYKVNKDEKTIKENVIRIKGMVESYIPRNQSGYLDWKKAKILTDGRYDYWIDNKKKVSNFKSSLRNSFSIFTK